MDYDKIIRAITTEFYEKEVSRIGYDFSNAVITAFVTSLSSLDDGVDDVVKVVKCKDCEFYGNGDCSVQSVRTMYPDDFCSYGKRKGGAKMDGGD